MTSLSRDASLLRKSSAGVFPASAVLRRKCGCRAHKPGGGTCETCAAKHNALQRKGTNQNEPGIAPQSVYDVLSAPGHPLDPQTRAFFEPRFGRSFENVRTHTDGRATNSAREVGAFAYAVGNDIVFGAGQYAPRTLGGRQTLAHELAHVAQQGGAGLHRKATPDAIAIGGASDGAERDADSAADAVMRMTEGADGGSSARHAVSDTTPSALRRKLAVDPADSVPAASGGKAVPLTGAVEGLLNRMCPSAACKVDAKTGAVTTRERLCDWHPPIVVGKTEADLTDTPTGCNCICDVIKSAQTATISFSPGGPGTTPGSVAGAGPGQGGAKTDSTVQVDPRFQGQYRVSGKWVDVPFHLLLTHELCGHALPKTQGTHVPRGAGPVGGTPPQEQHAVDVERAAAAEQKLPRRPDDYSGDARQKP